MARRHEQSGRILDTDRFVERRMQHQKRPFQLCRRPGHLRAAHILQELTFQDERTSRQLHLGFTLGLDGLDIGADGIDHMRRIRRRPDRGHRLHLRNLMRRNHYGGPAQRMPDQ